MGVWQGGFVSLHGLPLVAVLIDALRYTPSSSEDTAARMPPYPQPAYLREHQERVISELAARLPAAAKTPTVTRLFGQVRPYASNFSDAGWPFGRLEFSDAVCLLAASGALSVADANAIIDAVPSMDSLGLQRQIVLTHLSAGQVDRAREAADHLGESAWAAHRDIGDHYAARGDVRAFFDGWRSYASSKERDWMARLKSHLVAGVAERDGWSAAIEVTREKRIGAGYAIEAFRPWAATGDIDGLLDVFADQAHEVLTEIDELQVLVEALLVASSPAPEADHPRLGAVLDRIIAVDPRTDKATMRRRDHLLFTLWPAYGEQATLRRARAATRTLGLRAELTTLARDIEHGRPSGRVPP